MKQIIILALLIFITAGCGPSLETLATQTTDAETAITATPTEFLPTITPTATMEPTPEVPRPAISPNLAPINNASMAYENGTWVTKNATGKTTATFTETGWKYNNDNIAVEVIGWSSARPFELTRAKHPECFIKPEIGDTSLDFISNSQPVPDGFLKDTDQIYTRSSATYAWFAGRYVGSFSMPAIGPGGMIACIRVGDALVPVEMSGLISDFRTTMNIIKGNDPFQPIDSDGLTDMQIQKTVTSLPVGRQVVIKVPYNSLPENDYLTQQNKMAQQVVDALKGQVRTEGWLDVDLQAAAISWGIPEELIQK